MTLTRRDFGRNVLAGITAGTLIGAGCDSAALARPMPAQEAAAATAATHARSTRSKPPGPSIWTSTCCAKTSAKASPAPLELDRPGAGRGLQSPERSRRRCLALRCRRRVLGLPQPARRPRHERRDLSPRHPSDRRRRHRAVRERLPWLVPGPNDAHSLSRTHLEQDGDHFAALLS